ncbi:MAG TPA: NapC/NirT family cytochrome c [Bryobacteraceae bacterium]|nr:NapC/NirT family cytochrome c [Bryobacteraceae bacterium]
MTSHWLTMAGALLVTVAGFTWLLALPNLVRGNAGDPYIGILLFVILPILFFIGLVLMPIGVWRSRRAIRQGLRQMPSRESSLKRLAAFLAIATVLNVVIMSQLSYRAINYMEGTQFCGQSCHVMKPEFTAYQVSPHARVACVECHVTPGAAGWVKSKMSGTRQLMDVIFNTYPRPIPSAMETNRLVPASGTCEHCHWSQQFNGARLRVIPDYANDEKNTLTQTVLVMMVGGGRVPGIHGAHFGPGVSIRYGSTDSKRQTIPWVEYRDTSKNVTRTYKTSDLSPSAAGKLQYYDMQCVDCHNRPAHTFQSPERAVNTAMALGQIPVSLPFIKKKGVDVLRTSYASSDEAARKIPAAIRDYYRQTQPALYPSRSADVDQAANALLTIYNENVFPDLKVTWGTYANNLGHIDFPGCFRCHDEAHTSADQKTITQSCDACHEVVSSSEASPEVLKTLGIEKKLSDLQKK